MKIVWIHAPHHPHVKLGFNSRPFMGIVRHQYRWLREERGFSIAEARIVVLDLMLAGSGGNFVTSGSRHG